MIELKPYTIDIGERFGTLTVEQRISAKRGAMYRVVCACSYVFLARGSKLRRGEVKCNRCEPGSLNGRTLDAHMRGTPVP